MKESSLHEQTFSSSIQQPVLGQLRAVAHLYGVETPAVSQSRILGVGIGHNPMLASCALLFPSAEILDLAIGDSYFNAPRSESPGNYQFLSASLDQITPELGYFDYILCPDLAAYLSSEVVDELLLRCKAVLKPDGMICIGHPTYPGAKSLEVVRDALLLHLRDQKNCNTVNQKSQALTALSLFDEGAASTVYLGLSLKDAADYFRQQIEQGYLNIILNSPDALGQYFIEFAQTAHQAGLTCIGDGHPHLDIAQAWGIPVYTSNSLLTLGQAEVVRQQYLDFSTTRLWRQTLLIHEDHNAHINTTPHLEKLPDLRWAGCWEPLDWAPPYIGQVYQNNQGRQQKIPDKTTAQILDMLAIRWPLSLSIGELQHLCQVPAEEIILIITKQFESGTLNYCLADTLDGAPQNHLGITLLPQFTSQLQEIPGVSKPENIKQFDKRISDIWGNLVYLQLTYSEFLLLRNKNDYPDISDRILSDPTTTYNLIRKLNKLALLIYDKTHWHDFLDKILSKKNGIDGTWVMYLLHTYLSSSTSQGTHHGGDKTITPQQKNQMEKLDQVFSTENYAQAEALARQIIKTLPNYATPAAILVRALTYQGRYDEALSFANELRKKFPFNLKLYTAITIAIALRGNDIESLRIARPLLYRDDVPHYLYISLGLACKNSLRIESAEKFFRAGLEKNQDSTALVINLASLHSQQGKIQEGMALCRTIIDNKSLSKQAHTIAYNNLLFMTNYAADLDAEQIFEIYKKFEKDIFFNLYKNQKKHKNSKITNRKIRIGYVSADFREHAVSKFIEPIYKYLDRNQFIVYSYSNVSREDANTNNYKSLSNQWINIYGMSDAQAAAKIRTDEIDILVDLSGHTGGNRLGIFALKPAPVSVSWLGFGYTTGLSAIDYYLANNIICPLESDSMFAEKPWRIKGTWATYKPSIPDHFIEFKDQELDYRPSKKIISFISLSRVIRINNRVIRCWASILKQTPESRLILNSTDFENQNVCDNMRSKFLEHGITADRLFMGFATPPWASLRKADIGLDCFPHNSGTTLFDMLYMGVPFITLADRPSVGRLGASILTSVNHPEWISHSEDEYVKKVLSLADKITKNKFFDKTKLIEETNASDLADTKGFTEKLEAAYKQMFSIWAKKQFT